MCKRETAKFHHYKHLPSTYPTSTVVWCARIQVTEKVVETIKIAKVCAWISAIEFAEIERVWLTATFVVVCKEIPIAQQVVLEQI